MHMYTEESSDALSWMLHADINHYMECGGYLPPSADHIITDLLSIEDIAFVETLSGDCGMEQDAFTGFTLIEDTDYHPEDKHRLISRAETDRLVFILVQAQFTGFDFESARSIYICFKDINL